MPAQNPTPDHSLKSLKRHPQYYHPGGDLAIIVEDVSFRLPSLFFTRESPDFRDRLASETPKGNGADNKVKNIDDGAQPTHTIVIQQYEQVTPDDFSKLCWVFFNPKFSIYEAPLGTWKTVLRLANQWHLSEVKDLAFRELDTPNKFDIPLVERIVLYRQYDAEFRYLEPLYADLLSRPDLLTYDEGKALELKTALLIAGARERLRTNLQEPLCISSPLPESMKSNVAQMVKSIFQGGPPPPFGKTATGVQPLGRAGNGLTPMQNDSAKTTGLGSTDNDDKGGKKSKAGTIKKKGAAGLYDYDDPTQF